MDVAYWGESKWASVKELGTSKQRTVDSYRINYKLHKVSRFAVCTADNDL